MNIKVHRLGPGDVAHARDLNTLFAAAFEDAGTYAHRPPDDAYLAALLGKEHILALAAFADGKLAGGLVAYQLDKFEQARSEIYIYDLAVEASYRRQGIATALIDHLRRLAATRGTWAVFVQADHGDDPAVALYTKLGTREDVMHFDIAPLDGA